MRHTTTYERVGYFWIGWCACGERYGSAETPLRSRNDVEDLAMRHHVDVERKRANAHRGSHDLKVVYKNYMAEAEDPNNSEADRMLWKKLADEIGQRIGIGEPTTEQVALPLFDTEGE